MKYIIGFAGIEKEIFVEIEKKTLEIAEANAIFVGIPINGRHKNYGAEYAQSFLDQFIKNLTKHENTIIGCAIIYLSSDKNHPNQEFINTFFPSVLAIPLECNAHTNDKASISNLVDRLGDLAKVAKESINIIRDELTSRANKTPLLLPMKNFHSPHLLDLLLNLQKTLPFSENRVKELKDRVSNFINNYHNMQKIGSRKHSCFLDERAIEFHSPGRARHGFPTPTPDHSTSCILNGRLRLGAKYDPAFHYDCCKGSSPLHVDMHGCHTKQEMKRGKPHLNVSPNDFVRA